jgi:hypothetical protein
MTQVRALKSATGISVPRASPCHGLHRATGFTVPRASPCHGLHRATGFGASPTPVVGRPHRSNCTVAPDVPRAWASAHARAKCNDVPPDPVPRALALRQRPCDVQQRPLTTPCHGLRRRRRPCDQQRLPLFAAPPRAWAEAQARATIAASHLRAAFPSSTPNPSPASRPRLRSCNICSPLQRACSLSGHAFRRGSQATPLSSVSLRQPVSTGFKS